MFIITPDPWFGGSFDGRLEKLHFKKPPVVRLKGHSARCLQELLLLNLSVTKNHNPKRETYRYSQVLVPLILSCVQTVVCSYLQLVCLVENVRTDPGDVCSLPAAQAGDIRQALLQLQLWVRSGGGPAAAPPLLLSHPVEMPQGLPSGRAQTRGESVERGKLPADHLPPCDTGCSGTRQEFLVVCELAKMFKVSFFSNLIGQI